MTPEMIRARYGSIYPAWEYELAGSERTGRRRRSQFVPTPYRLCVPPSARTPEPWEGGGEGR